MKITEKQAYEERIKTLLYLKEANYWHLKPLVTQNKTFAGDEMQK